MMYKSRCFILLISIQSVLMIGCKENHKNAGGLVPNDLIGTWSNLSMRIEYTESDSIFVVPEGEWEAILKIKPIQTTFSNNGQYESKYYNLNDSLLFATIGEWAISNDSLYLTESGNTTGYQVKMDLPKATFTGYLDWDQDGDVNEKYTGVQIKASSVKK